MPQKSQNSSCATSAYIPSITTFGVHPYYRIQLVFQIPIFGVVKKEEVYRLKPANTPVGIMNANWSDLNRKSTVCRHVYTYCTIDGSRCTGTANRSWKVFHFFAQFFVRPYTGPHKGLRERKKYEYYNVDMCWPTVHLPKKKIPLGNECSVKPIDQTIQTCRSRGSPFSNN